VLLPREAALPPVLLQPLHLRLRLALSQLQREFPSERSSSLLSLVLLLPLLLASLPLTSV